ncbi:MAG: peptide chain release factor N(5)-glutamine methyltransferase, partial [Gammaproteobacteria bacterium]|nr:peptide chain release factor N(5)-glutamine methyltransferase [Gammaproteobacteria bacterium]
MTAPLSITHQQWLNQSTTEFNSLSGTASLDARVLLCHCLDKPLSYLLAWPDRVISDSDLVQLNSLKERRLAGEPIAYITGFREFWSMNFKVTSDVLIPRPETEILVEWALQKVSILKTDKKILELGTGSGAIAVALASENPKFHITATDISANALDIASENALLNDCPNITFLQGSWFECVAEDGFDLI